MIEAAVGPAAEAEFLRRAAGKPYFAPVLSTHLKLYADKPASGWSFYLLPGAAALMMRGGTANLCGRVGEGDAEELRDFLQFMRADRIITEEGALPFGSASPLLLWQLPRGHALLVKKPKQLARLRLDTHPAMMPVSELVFGAEKKFDRCGENQQTSFYAAACTAINHGCGLCYALLDETAQPVCTVGSYERSETECYLSAGVTAPGHRGEGLAGYLIPLLANELAHSHEITFTSAPHLERFYSGLGFIQSGILYNVEL